MGRPKEPLIDRVEVVNAALEIIDTAGLEALSLRRLGKVLGVNAASFYYHFESKNEILVEVAKHILRDNRLVEHRPESWEALAIQYTTQYRDALAAHPNIVPFMELRPHRQFATDFWDAYSRMFLDVGLPPEQVMPLLDALESLVLGHVRTLGLGSRPFGDLSIFPALQRVVEADILDPKERFELAARALLRGWPGADAIGQPSPGRSSRSRS